MNLRIAQDQDLPGYYFAGNNGQIRVLQNLEGHFIPGANVFPLQDRFLVAYKNALRHGAYGFEIVLVETEDFETFSNKRIIFSMNKDRSGPPGNGIGYPQGDIMGDGRLGLFAWVAGNIVFFYSDDEGESWQRKRVGGEGIMIKGPTPWPAKAGGADGEGWIVGTHKGTGAGDPVMVNGIRFDASRPYGPGKLFFYRTRDNGESWDRKMLDQGPYAQWLACEGSSVYIGDGRHITTYRINAPGQPFGISTSVDGFESINGVYPVGARGLEDIVASRVGTPALPGIGKSPLEMFYNDRAGTLHIIALCRGIMTKDNQYPQVFTAIETFADAESVFSSPSDPAHWAPWKAIHRQEKGIAVEGNTTPPFKMPNGSWAMSFGHKRVATCIGNKKTSTINGKVRPALLTRA